MQSCVHIKSAYSYSELHGEQTLGQTYLTFEHLKGQCLMFSNNLHCAHVGRWMFDRTIIDFIVLIYDFAPLVFSLSLTILP